MYRLYTQYTVIRRRRTDRQTDDSIMPIADHAACSITIAWKLVWL